LLTLDYRLDPTAAEKAKESDMASADAASLRYRLFPGDIVLKAEDADFSTHWGWVQVLDFALSLINVEVALARDGKARFEFTESDAALNLWVEGNVVCVSSSYAPGLMQIPASEFHDQVKRFEARVTRDLCDQHPRLALNPELRRAAP
jgi:hypothetical protein